MPSSQVELVEVSKAYSFAGSLSGQQVGGSKHGHELICVCRPPVLGECSFYQVSRHEAGSVVGWCPCSGVVRSVVASASRW